MRLFGEIVHVVYERLLGPIKLRFVVIVPGAYLDMTRRFFDHLNEWAETVNGERSATF